MLDFAPLSAVLAGGTFSFVSIFMEPLTTTGTKNPAKNVASYKPGLGISSSRFM